MSDGKIFSKRIRQVIEFSGIRYGNATPTDIDGLMELHDRCYILYEFKYKDALAPYGQRIALERLANDLRKAGKEAVVFLCSHNQKDPEQNVRAKDAIVTGIYWGGKWHKGTGKTAEEQTRLFLQWAEKACA